MLLALAVDAAARLLAAAERFDPPCPVCGSLLNVWCDANIREFGCTCGARWWLSDDGAPTPAYRAPG